MSRACSILASLPLLLFAAMPASADNLNGGFESGGDDWFPIFVPPWNVSFPATGGNPNGYALVQSPLNNSQGLAGVLQGFPCGTPGGGSTCLIMFDYRLRQVSAADNTGRVKVFIDNEPDFTSASGNIDWTRTVLVVPCGDHSIGLTLEVDAGNNAWEASFDNVQSFCEVTTPVQGGMHSGTWGAIKSAFYR
jgi:hypothetical protein